MSLKNYTVSLFIVNWVLFEDSACIKKIYISINGTTIDIAIKFYGLLIPGIVGLTRVHWGYIVQFFNNIL